MGDARKLGFMLKDLKAMKQELQPKEEVDMEEKKELKNLDKFQNKKHELNKHLKNLREGINRLVELRKSAKDPNARDGIMIKLSHENTAGLTKASTLFAELRKLLDADFKKRAKKLGEKVLSDRKKQVELLGTEIKTLVAMNSTHLSADDVDLTANPAAGDGRNRSRTQRKREERKARQENRKARRAGRGKKGGVNIHEDVEFKDANPMSQQEQQFMDQVAANQEEQNEILDEIGKTMDELHELSLDMNKQLTLQSDLIHEVDNKMDTVMDKMSSANMQMKKMLDENGGMTRWCPLLCFFTLILGLVGYIFNVIPTG